MLGKQDTQPGATSIPINSTTKLNVEFDGEYHKIQYIDTQASSQVHEQRQNLDQFEATLKAMLKWYRFTVDPDFGKDRR